MTTHARHFKFAETAVQRLQLVMVALTQNEFACNMVGFVRKGHVTRFGKPSVWDQCAIRAICAFNTSDQNLLIDYMPNLGHARKPL